MLRDWEGYGHSPAFDSVPELLGSGGLGDSDSYTGNGWSAMVRYFEHLIGRASSEQQQGLGRWLQRMQIHYCSICCGSGATVLLLKQFQEALTSTTGYQARLQHDFSCEADVAKQRHLLATISPHILFTDAHDLVHDSGFATDAVLGLGESKRSRVPTFMDLVLAGFPCQDVSSLNTGSANARDCCASGCLRTGGVFRSILSFAKLKKAWLGPYRLTRVSTEFAEAEHLWILPMGTLRERERGVVVSLDSSFVQG